eukprot:gene37985-40910_t
MLLRAKSVEAVEDLSRRIESCESNLAKSVRGLAQVDKEMTGIYKHLFVPVVEPPRRRADRGDGRAARVGPQSAQKGGAGDAAAADDAGATRGR